MIESFRTWPSDQLIWLSGSPKGESLRLLAVRGRPSPISATGFHEMAAGSISSRLVGKCDRYREGSWSTHHTGVLGAVSDWVET